MAEVYGYESYLEDILKHYQCRPESIAEFPDTLTEVDLETANKKLIQQDPPPTVLTLRSKQSWGKTPISSLMETARLIVMRNDSVERPGKLVVVWDFKCSDYSIFSDAYENFLNDLAHRWWQDYDVNGRCFRDVRGFDIDFYSENNIYGTPDDMRLIGACLLKKREPTEEQKEVKKRSLEGNVFTLGLGTVKE